MILKGGSIAAFLRTPDPAVRAALFYGPDRGLVRERASAAMDAAAGGAPDPFGNVELDAAAVKGDPGRIADEAAALTFGGGRRIVRLREATDAATEALQRWIEGRAGDGFVVVEAGDLAKRSSLRKLFEAADAAVAVACYPETGAELERTAGAALAAEGVRIEPDALAYLASRLGADRALMRGELEKLVVYLGDRRTVTADDITACVGDSRSVTLDAVSDAACRGDQAALERAFTTASEEGVSPVAILRATARHVQRLLEARALVARGLSPDKAVGALRPPVFYKARDSLLRQVTVWTETRLATALGMLTDAEIDCKSTGMPDQMLCRRVLMRIAQAARSR